MVPATFHFPGQEHQQTAKLTSVSTGNHTPQKPAETGSAKAASQQRRIIALQLAQKQTPNASVDVWMRAAATVDNFILHGAPIAEANANGATAVKPGA